MKLIYKRIVTTVTIVAIVVTIMWIILSTSFGKNDKQDIDDMSIENGKGGNEEMGSDEEYGHLYKISKNGASLYAYNSNSSQVVEAAKKFIVESGYDSKNISFVFKNSEYSFSQESVIKYMLDMFFPEKIEDEQVYFVEENYNGEIPICVGYFAVNENGDIVGSKFLKTEKELEEYKLKPEISLGDAITIAEKGKSSLQVLEALLFYYNDDKECLCYKIRFDNGEKVYVNALTGEIVGD